MEEKNEQTIQLLEKEDTEVIEQIIYNEVQDETKPKKRTKIILIITLIIILLILLLSIIFAVVNLGNDKIIKGIYIENIDVSNMTKENATKKLQETFSKRKEFEINIKYDEHETIITYEALEVNYKIEEAVNKAQKIGRNGNLFKDNIDILNSLINTNKIELDASLDEEVVEQLIENMNNSLENALVEASYYIEDDKLIIVAGKEGKVVDKEILVNEIYKCLNNDLAKQEISITKINQKPQEIDIQKIHDEVYKEVQDAYYEKNPFKIYVESDGIDFDIENAKTILAEEKAEYEIPLIITKPSKTVDQIGTEAFPDLISTFSTNYKVSEVNRTTNLRLAAQKINGKVLMPGEEFSYNKTVGERTIAAGFKSAAIFSGGQVVDGLGGGICQISTTLYDAVVFANLEITERRNHQFVTSYAPAGRDATVVWGSQDFKFKNTRDYPIKIEASVNGGIAKVNIWGLKEEVEYDISIQTKQTATIKYTTQYIDDPTLPAGTEVVVQAGNNGRKVEAYKVVKLNGQTISTTLLSKDTYNAKKHIVRRGTAVQQ